MASPRLRESPFTFLLFTYKHNNNNIINSIEHIIKVIYLLFLLKFIIGKFYNFNSKEYCYEKNIDWIRNWSNHWNY